MSLTHVLNITCDSVGCTTETTFDRSVRHIPQARRHLYEAGWRWGTRTGYTCPNHPTLP